MKSYIRQWGLVVIRLLGSNIVDVVDGEILGKAILIPWRGRVHLMGYEGIPLRMVCIPQEKVRYWRITVGFTKAEVPDYGRLPRKATPRG